MKRTFLPAVALSCLAWLTIGAAGCGSPLVGLECKAGYTRCGDECFDFRVDENHCGGCNVQCAADEMCVASACTTDFDASTDGGRGDSGLDGSTDGSTDGGLDGGLDGSMDDAGDGGGMLGDGSLDGDVDGDTNQDGGWTDVDLPPLCTGPTSPPECVCELGQLICDRTCIDGNNDIDNCGACGRRCFDPAIMEPDRFFCVDGQCVLNCAPPRTVCGNLCIDLTNDPNNCGQCGRVCESGLCENNECLDATAGHVIVIGHDMTNSLPAMRRLAGNALFLPARQRVRGLIYGEFTPVLAAAGVQSAIAEVESTTGRVFEQVVTNPPASDIPLWLSRVDVFAISAQTLASEADLLRNGTLWARALTSFVQRGGVIVLFDGGGSNGGTHQILEEPGLFVSDGFEPLPVRTVFLEATNDLVSSLVPVRYQAQNNSIVFDTSADVVVIRDRDTGLPVVVHISR